MSFLDWLSPVTNSESSIPCKLDSIIRGVPRKDALLLLVNFLDQCTAADELNTAACHYIYQKILNLELWNAQYSTLESFNTIIDYTTVIEPIIDRYHLTQSRKDLKQQEVEGRWGLPLDVILGPDNVPAAYSRDFLYKLNSLSKIVTSTRGLELLTAAKAKRLEESEATGRGGKRACTYLIVADCRSAVAIAENEDVIELDDSVVNDGEVDDHGEPRGHEQQEKEWGREQDEVEGYEQDDEQDNKQNDEQDHEQDDEQDNKQNDEQGDKEDYMQDHEQDHEQDH
jgi:hypothetical protein